MSSPPKRITDPEHLPTLGAYHLYGRQSAEPLFTENEHNAEHLWGSAYWSQLTGDRG
jgi:hypothetical protein